MANMSWNISLTKDGGLSVGMLKDRKQLGYVTMISNEVERLIALLAQFRAQMKPEVDRTPGVEKLSTGLQDPLFAVGDLPVLPGKALAIRHDGIGWLSFYFQDQEASKLANALLDRSVRPPSGPTQTHH